MIRLELEEYSHYSRRPERPDISLELADEGVGIWLSIGFEPNEYGWPKDRSVNGADYPDDVTRTLRPEEARALAGMLVHFANEAERPR